MQINLLSKNIELSDSIKDYVEKRVTNLEKLLSRIESRHGEITVNFEVGRSSNHHKGGQVFHADCQIRFGGKKFYASVEADDVYAAIDEVKETLFNDIEKNKDRKQTLFRQGASNVKKMMKGLSKRNPFTSKY